MLEYFVGRADIELAATIAELRRTKGEGSGAKDGLMKLSLLLLLLQSS